MNAENYREISHILCDYKPQVKPRIKHHNAYANDLDFMSLLEHESKEITKHFELSH